jgi:hypothetical protein
MKKLFLLLVAFLFSVSSYSQGTILGFTVEPQSPTTIDFVKVYVGLVFTSGGCNLDNKNHTTINNMTDAFAHHCLGPLTYICNTTDTFELGYLPTGTHKFRLGLTSGGFPGPCTPGVVQDDVDSTSFFVAVANGVIDVVKEERAIKIFPNPVQDVINIEVIDNKLIDKDYNIIITDVLGNQVFVLSSVELKQEQHVINLQEYSQGIYFMAFYQNNRLVSTKKFLKEK